MADAYGPPPGMRAIQAELLSREPIFHKPGFGTSRSDYAAQAP
jgi:hypothetical protein